MLTYQSVQAWVERQSVIRNRADIVNQMLGCGVPGMASNPCQVRYLRGRGRGVYVVDFCGEEFARYRAYDGVSTDCAYVRLQALNDGIWLAMRSGVLRLV